MEHTIRTVRAGEWERVKELRLAGLGDPAAPVAFLDTYENAVARPDAYWRERARGNTDGDTATTFIAEGPDGGWAGTVTVRLELPGVDNAFGTPAGMPQTHLTGVFVRPEHRGTGLADALFRAAIDHSWSLDEPRVARVRLYVHERNDRARAFYRKLGFEPTGEALPLEADPSAFEHEMSLARPRR
ncbi:GNAT family N-acetyltransferase [Streptomyces sp. ISL-11]|uniref:GNAT family N-acetyltransferase n=1 Tax=Streptomyces sp. ISL-11 TaxID=2819174 RepID=UPI001BE9B77E|nr:GNAT family N-acetyltransferase [Streptomyces sp. ISL-11]MBT2386215.1 GNAT family N-acetyltransferase [Streptomyces sp. ISL-11]